jgi:hypothetical protein
VETVSYSEMPQCIGAMDVALVLDVYFEYEAPVPRVLEAVERILAAAPYDEVASIGPELDATANGSRTQEAGWDERGELLNLDDPTRPLSLDVQSRRR